MLNVRNQIQVNKTGNIRPIEYGISASYAKDETVWDMPNKYEVGYSAQVIMGCNQIWRDSADKIEVEHIKDRVAREISHMLYGEVLKRLHKMESACYRDNQRPPEGLSDLIRDIDHLIRG